MEPREAAQIIALMRATWPHFAPDEIADRLWLEDLLGYDYALAERTWRYLRDHDERAPSWARFEAVIADRGPVWARGIEARNTLTSPPRPALPAGHTETWQEAHERRQATIARLRLERSQQAARDAAARPKEPPRPSTVDPLAEIPTYDELYGEKPDPDPGPPTEPA